MLIKLPELRAHFMTIENAADRYNIPIGEFVHGTIEARNRQYRALIGNCRYGLNSIVFPLAVFLFFFFANNFASRDGEGRRHQNQP